MNATTMMVKVMAHFWAGEIGGASGAGAVMCRPRSWDRYVPGCENARGARLAARRRGGLHQAGALDDPGHRRGLAAGRLLPADLRADVSHGSRRPERGGGPGADIERPGVPHDASDEPRAPGARPGVPRRLERDGHRPPHDLCRVPGAERVRRRCGRRGATRHLSGRQIPPHQARPDRGDEQPRASVRAPAPGAHLPRRRRRLRRGGPRGRRLRARRRRVGGMAVHGLGRHARSRAAATAGRRAGRDRDRIPGCRSGLEGDGAHPARSPRAFHSAHLYR